ncbi:MULTISPECIES: hypothetical protein [Exiguobacterium]|uniref:hypothetical protein n=1 Tax=Exiguobacterium TaxID=33986 RepID=UPI001AE40442|nr:MULTISPECIES: hypothetical protein [Exiguobacterium]MCT4779838.1 hypothetical protein [Exiguobacterium soli]
MWTVKYSRYYERMERKFDTEKAALDFAVVTVDYEYGYVIEILDPADEVFMTAKGLSDYMIALDEAEEEQS